MIVKILEINNCAMCPHSAGAGSHCYHPDLFRIVHRNMRAGGRKTIPDWCLLDNKPEKEDR